MAGLCEFMKSKSLQNPDELPASNCRHCSYIYIYTINYIYITIQDLFITTWTNKNASRTFWIFMVYLIWDFAPSYSHSHTCAMVLCFSQISCKLSPFQGRSCGLFGVAIGPEGLWLEGFPPLWRIIMSSASCRVALSYLAPLRRTLNISLLIPVFPSIPYTFLPCRRYKRMDIFTWGSTPSLAVFRKPACRNVTVLACTLQSVRAYAARVPVSTSKCSTSTDSISQWICFLHSKWHHV